MAEVLSTVAGAVLGLVTGYFFEKRATRSALRQNEELRRELSVLRATIVSLGGQPGGRQAVVPVPDDLAGAVTARALATQDPSGRVERRALVAHFLERGDDVREVETAIDSLCAAGVAKEEGSWLQIA